MVPVEFVIVMAVMQAVSLMFWQVLYNMMNSIDAMVFLLNDVNQQWSVFFLRALFEEKQTNYNFVTGSIDMILTYLLPSVARK